MNSTTNKLRKEFEKKFLQGSIGSMNKTELLNRDGNAHLMELIWSWIEKVYLQAKEEGSKYWQEEARRYAKNTDFWRKKAEKAKEEGRKEGIKEVEGFVDEFISLQERKAGLTEQDSSVLLLALSAFLMEFKLSHSIKERDK